MISDYTDDTNIILITLDSCRWDSFELASARSLKSLGKFRKAHSQATFTYASHLSIFSGILPDIRDKLPYYNRFCKNLFRISGRKAKVEAYIEFPVGTNNIIEGFNGLGYETFGCAALEWFKHPALTQSFKDFYFSGINLEAQIQYIQMCISKSSRPFFGFMNIGETHDPYESGGLIQPSLHSRARMRSFSNEGFLIDDHKKQIKAVEFIDKKLAYLFEVISNQFDNNLIIVCGDHGECFGEDGLYGHGFYHPKVMEVPLGIFNI